MNHVNRLPDVEPVLRAYLADTGDRAPDRVLTDVAARIARQPRRVWRLRGRPFMNAYAKLGVAAAAIIVVAVAGYAILPRTGPGPGGPVATPTPSPTPVVTPSAVAYQCEEASGCLGELAGGLQRTSQFAPGFTYTTPAGWFNQIDIPTLVGITPADQPADMLLVWSGAVPAEQTATCQLRAKAGAGSTASDWITYLQGHPGLATSNLRNVTIGGLNAKSIDIRVPGGWTSPCVDDRARGEVRILKTPDGAPGDGYGVGSASAARVYVVDVGDQTVVVTLYAYTGGESELVRQIVMGEPVVTSFTFVTP